MKLTQRRLTLLALTLLSMLIVRYAPLPTQPPQSTVQVVRTVDGDTIVIRENGVEKSVRLIGVDTPETKDPRVAVECFGAEASEFTRSLAKGPVRLVSDPSQGDVDKYGRLLRYVYIGDTFLNKTLIQEGYGFEYTYSIPYRFRDEFRQAQREAQMKERGLWNPRACRLDKAE